MESSSYLSLNGAGGIADDDEHLWTQSCDENSSCILNRTVFSPCSPKSPSGRQLCVENIYVSVEGARLAFERSHQSQFFAPPWKDIQIVSVELVFLPWFGNECIFEELDELAAGFGVGKAVSRADGEVVDGSLELKAILKLRRRRQKTPVWRPCYVVAYKYSWTKFVTIVCAESHPFCIHISRPFCYF
jgi:hypothetical protein